MAGGRKGKTVGMSRPTDRKWSSLSHTSYYHESTVLVKLEGTKFRRAQKMAQVAETNSVIILSQNLTNIRSTCILRFELGLERKD